MATFSITTTDQQDKAVQYVVAKINATEGTNVSPLEYARKRIDHLLNGIVQQVQDETRISKGDLYNRATDADQATIDAILQKYR